jgi:hypothetical protein
MYHHLHWKTLNIKKLFRSLSKKLRENEQNADNSSNSEFSLGHTKNFPLVGRRLDAPDLIETNIQTTNENWNL